MSVADERRTIPREASLRMRQAQVIQAHRRALIAQRDLDNAQRAADEAQSELAEQVADTLGDLTPKLRKWLRTQLSA